jgi:Ca2+-binding RTX toxin-like protein
MYALVYVTIISFVALSVFTSYVNVYATKLNSTDSITSNFSNNLKSKIHNIISEALNRTSNTTNSSLLLTNGSNLTSNQVVISKSTVVSNTSSNGSHISSTIKNKVTTINGVCSSEKIGGYGNDTLSSIGKCNDQLTGGLGADKFTCGEGNDTIKDYNPKEGDIILDRPNCEKIL